MKPLGSAVAGWESGELARVAQSLRPQIHQEDCMNELDVYESARLVQLPPAALYVLMKGGVIAARKKPNGFYTTQEELLGWARRWGGRLSQAGSHV